MHHPTRTAAVMLQFHNAFVGFVKQACQFKLCCGLPNTLLGRQRKDALRGRIQETKDSRGVEGEYWRVNRADDAPQQCRCFQRTRTLVLQHIGQCVDLSRQLAQDIAAG